MAKRKFKKVNKTKSGVPKKYLANAKNKTEREKEILATRKKYKAGEYINIKKVSDSRAKKVKRKSK